MRMATAALALGVATVALAGCASPVAGTPAPVPAVAPAGAPAAPLADRYTDPQSRFRLRPPVGWTADPTPGTGITVRFRAPRPQASAAGPFSPNINVYVVASPDDLATTVAGARQDMAAVNAYHRDSDLDVVLSDGTPAHQLGGTFTDPASGLELRNLQLFTVHGGMAVAVAGTALADGWDDYGNTFDASLRTLAVTP
ncbi:hypothetical protein [Pseudonocardia sp. GCM10023141]|uniref:hypothetical protein n=1 Tax=Pseudonocardia sp. GCM10023141 TaxID=3252653 RepID=UPI00360C2C7A